MEYLIILNYNTGEVFVKIIQEGTYEWSKEDYENSIKEEGLNLDEVNWMITDSLNIQFI